MKRHKLITAAISGIIAAAAPLAQGAVTWTAGAPGGSTGGALDFDQSEIFDTGVATADIYGSGGTGTGDYTVSAWINPDTTNEAWFLGTQNEALHVGILNGTLQQGHWNADSSGSTAIVAGDWIHATFSYDADGGTGGTTGLQSIYINGVLDSSADNNAPNNSNTNIVIGGRIRNSSAGEVTGLNRQPFDGQVDDVAIFDSALTAAEIADLASGTQGALALGANAFFDFEDDQTGTTAAVQGALGSNIDGIVAIVPEPSSLALVILGAAGFLRRKRH